MKSEVDDKTLYITLTNSCKPLYRIDGNFIVNLGIDGYNYEIKYVSLNPTDYYTRIQIGGIPLLFSDPDIFYLYRVEVFLASVGIIMSDNNIPCGIEIDISTVSQNIQDIFYSKKINF